MSAEDMEHARGYAAGMTERAYIATAALQGMLGYVSVDDWMAGHFKRTSADKYVEAAVGLADALLAALKETK